MEVLLDTHALIWYRTSHVQLPDSAKIAIEESTNRYVSKASLWEIFLLIEKGKIPFGKSVSEYVFHLLNDDFIFLEIELNDLEKLLALPDVHKDPFDRMLVAQASNRNLTLITKDTFIQKYPVETLW